MRLTAGARVEGRVTTADGQPVAGERINLAQGFDFFSAKTSFTDANGAYVVPRGGRGRLPGEHGPLRERRRAASRRR